MPELYEALDSSEALLWVTPLFFASIPAQLKAVIDRFQVYYGRRLLRGKPAAPRRPAAAVIIGGGGDPFGAGAAIITLRSASQMAEFSLSEPLVITGPDAPGDIATPRFASQRDGALALVDTLRERARDSGA
jgi:multimeric flavodoxin WrbA